MIQEQLLHMPESSEDILMAAPPEPSRPFLVWSSTCGALPMGYDERRGDGMFADDYDDFDRYPQHRDDLVAGGRW